jgi:preprotein translocase, SecE subunit, bacterial
MAKNLPENNIGNSPEQSEAVIHNVSREELKQAKREAKLQKQKQKDAAVAADNSQAAGKSASKGKAVAQSKPKLSKRIAKTFKEVISELKKVTWPRWKVVLASTGVVIVFVLFFLIVLTAMDVGLSTLVQQLTNWGTK